MFYKLLGISIGRVFEALKRVKSRILLSWALLNRGTHCTDTPNITGTELDFSYGIVFELSPGRGYRVFDARAKGFKSDSGSQV